MSNEEEEFEEQNLDYFLENASEILNKSNDESKETILESLKDFLFTTFQDKDESDNFFKTLNSVIFPSIDNDTKKSFNEKPFKLYPIIFSFNKKLSVNYINYFLSSIKQSIKVENESYFSFLNSIFSEIITCFYNNNDKCNNNINNISDLNKNLIDDIQKQKLFEQLFNFCNSNIKTNQKTEQSFGLLLLTELIEKCPLVIKEKNLKIIFDNFSEYLKNKTLICKLDLLNCIISLILVAQEKFRPYSKDCLFSILDLVKDKDWMKRKLAINIVCTLTFFCKEQIMSFKENIIDFFNLLKEEPIIEIRIICYKTLELMGENELAKIFEIKKEENNHINDNDYSNINNKKISNDINNGYTIISLGDKKIEISEDSRTSPISPIGNDFTESYSTNKKNKMNYGQNNSNQKILYEKKPSKKSNKLNIRKRNNDYFKEQFEEIPSLNYNYINFKGKDRSSKDKIKKNKSSRAIRNNNKLFNTRNNTYNSNENNNFYNNSYSNLENFEGKKNLGHNKSSELNGFYFNNENLYPKKSLNKLENKIIKNETMNELKEKIIKKRLFLKEHQNTKRKNQIQISPFFGINPYNKNNSRKLKNTKIGNNKKEINANKYKKKLNNENINNDSNFNTLSKQLKIIMLSQNNLLEMINNIKNTVDSNFSILDKRIKKLENNNYSNREKQFEEKIVKLDSKDTNSINELNDNDNEIELISEKYMSGKFNEAIKEAIENDKYLYKLLPLISREDITKIDLSIIEELVISLNKKLLKLCKGEGKNNISKILSFYNQISRSKINKKLILQMDIKDTLLLIKNTYNIKLSQKDITIIDNILKSLNV